MTTSDSPAGQQENPAVLDVDALLSSTEVNTILCCGSGGVGKTTTSAALAVRAAELGRRVVVLTIDPARRLAQSLGLEELDNTPREVAGIDTSAGGSLKAMMLDMKRTFDEVVHTHTTPEKAEAILANPFYQVLSSSFAGTGEYMAMEKLGQLRSPDWTDRDWDLVIVDTPPSRSALDFLDAPQRLASFLDGPFIRLLMAPARRGGRVYRRVVGSAMGAVTALMSKLLGSQVLVDVQAFVLATDTMFGGFRERAQATYASLQQSGTAFLVIAAPNQDALREAAYFVERLAGEQMPVAGVVVNRVTTTAAAGLSAEEASRAADVVRDSHPVTAELLLLHAEQLDRMNRETGLIRTFRAGHPAVAHAEVAALPEDVHDLAGLRLVGELLAAYSD